MPPRAWAPASTLCAARQGCALQVNVAARALQLQSLLLRLFSSCGCHAPKRRSTLHCGRHLRLYLVTKLCPPRLDAASAPPAHPSADPTVAIASTAPQPLFPCFISPFCQHLPPLPPKLALHSFCLLARPAAASASTTLLMHCTSINTQRRSPAARRLLPQPLGGTTTCKMMSAPAPSDLSLRRLRWLCRWWVECR